MQNIYCSLAGPFNTTEINKNTISCTFGKKQLGKCWAYMQLLPHSYPLFTGLGAAAETSLKLGRVGILTLGLLHATSCKHLDDFQEKHG